MVEVIVTFKDGTIESYRSTDSRCDRYTFGMCSREVCMKAFGTIAGTISWFDPCYHYERNTRVHEHYGATIKFKPLDGRTKYAKSLPWYTTLIY